MLLAVSYLYKICFRYTIYFMSLSPKDLQSLKEQLEKEAGELEAQLKTVGKSQEFGSDVDHFEEEADEAEELSNSLDLTATIKERLRNIDQALDKMSKNAYGVCEQCQKEVSLELLRVDPESKLCKECKR